VVVVVGRAKSTPIRHSWAGLVENYAAPGLFQLLKSSVLQLFRCRRSEARFFCFSLLLARLGSVTIEDISSAHYIAFDLPPGLSQLTKDMYGCSGVIFDIMAARDAQTLTIGSFMGGSR